jgi:predicted dienelactone hydrolase
MILLMPALFLACPDPEDELSEADPLDEWGPWAVGTREDSFTSSDGLLMPVQVWYPTESESTLTHLYDDLVEGQALEDTDAACGESRPVLVFSHGNGGVRFQSYFLMEHLASHGFVVVAPDHVGNTFLDMSGETEDLMFRRPIDVAETFDWLVAGSGLEPCVDSGAGYALSGHSFGGYTTLATAGARIHADESREYCDVDDEWLCDGVAQWFAENPGETIADLSDDRVWAAVPMAPAGYEAVIGGLGEIAVPTLVLGGTVDTITSMEKQVQPIYDGLEVSPRHLGVLQEANHFTFSNACDLAPSYEGCTDASFLSNELAHPLIAEVTTAFLFAVLGHAGAESYLPPGDQNWVWTAE